MTFDASSLALLKAGGPVLVSLVVGVFGIWIARGQREIQANQRRIAQAKLNLDLFEKRYELFFKVRALR